MSLVYLKTPAQIQAFTITPEHVQNLEVNPILWELRNVQGPELTQTFVANHMGSTQSFISQVEGGRGNSDRRNPSLSTLVNYLDAIGYDLVAVKRKK